MDSQARNVSIKFIGNQKEQLFFHCFSCLFLICKFQFRDFLQLYNKLTEMCFLHCTDNLFSRDLSTTESSCLDRCVSKFSNVNQRIMSAYIHDQSIINERRMKEMEVQAKAASEAAAAANALAPATTNTADLVNPTVITSIDSVVESAFQNQNNSNDQQNTT